MDYKQQALDFLGVTLWHSKGYKGKGIKIISDEKVTQKCFPNIISPNGWKTKRGHGDDVMAHLELVAPEATLIAYPFSGSFSDTKYDCDCVQYIKDNNVSIFTTSCLSATINKGKTKAMQDCIDVGCTFFAAAGNDNEKGVRGESKSEKYLAIGGVKPRFVSQDEDDVTYNWNDLYKVSYSSVGKELDYVTLAEILGANGTSFCAPVFAGMCGLVQQFFLEKAGRTLTRAELIRFINDNLIDTLDEGFDIETGYGLFVLPDPNTIKISDYVPELNEGIIYTGFPEVKDMDIKENLTLTNYKKENNAKKYIVIHYTSNNGDTAYSNTEYFKSEYRGASAHYFVDEKNIYRCVEDDYVAWHCGALSYKHSECRNNNSIGIEMCSRKDNNGTYYIKDEVVDKTIELTKYLMNKYNIPVENVLRHYDVTGKNCPEPFVREPKLWDNFKARLESEVEEMRYKTVEEMPEWAREPIQNLIDKGILSGRGGDAGLDLSDDMVRVLILAQKIFETK